MSLASERIGVKFTTKKNEQVIVIDYVNYDKVQVMFLDEHKWTKWTSWDILKDGRIISPFTKTVYNIGYLGTNEIGKPMTTVDETGKTTREYKVWANMIERCYDGKERHKTYQNVTVCDRWLCYAYFLEDLPKIKNYEYWRDNPQQRIALNKDIYYSELGIITDCKEYNLLTTRFIGKSDNMKEVGDRIAKRVKAIHKETGQVREFESISQASRVIQSQGTDRTKEKRIGDCLHGKSKSAYGYYWEYV